MVDRNRPLLRMKLKMSEKLGTIVKEIYETCLRGKERQKTYQI